MAGNRVTIVDDDGEKVTVTGGKLDVNASVTGSDGAIQDGVDTGIKATVFDFTNANPLAVVLRDTNGDYVAVGGGTQYTEDAAAAADPVGTALALVRDDALSGQTTADGDIVAARGTDKGELYVKHADSVVVADGGGSLTIDAAALPLPTGAATAANQLPDGHNVTVDNAAGASAVNIQDGGNTITVDGAVTVSGTVDTELTTGDLDTGAGTDTRAVVGLVGSKSGGGELIPGSATDGLLVNLGANNDVVVSGTVSVTEPVSIDDNAGSITVDGTITVQGDLGTLDQLDLASADPLTVAIVDGTGAQITSFGGGVQYTEADTDATITGTAVMWEDAADTLRVASSAKPLPVNVVAGGAGDGAILDGVSAAIKATVFDYTNSNPLGVVLRDTNGDYVSVGGGTQYTEDAAAAADPVGTALMMVRDDALSGQTTADGDNVAARGTDKGELYVKHVDAIPVTDNGGALTVDGTVAVSSVGGTVAVTQSGVWDEIGINDSGNSITVDGSVSITGAVDTELTTADLDTGAGTDTRAVVGLVGSASGGGELIPGSAADGLLVNLGANNDVTVAGVATAANQLPDGHNVTVDNAAGASAVNVQDGGNSLTVDNAALSVVGGGAEATALRVTIANDSTGVVSIDDNGGAITVDGTVAVSGTVTVDLGANNDVTVTSGNITAAGAAAADAAASGNPLQIGVVQETMADSAPGTRMSADSDIGYVAASDGAVYVIPTGPQTWSYHANGSSALTDAVVHAAPAAGLSLYVTDIIISSGAATAINVFFEEGASTVLGPYYLEAIAGRGCQIHFQTPKKITAATALTVTSSAAIAHSVDVTGFIARG